MIAWLLTLTWLPGPVIGLIRWIQIRSDHGRHGAALRRIEAKLEKFDGHTEPHYPSATVVSIARGRLPVWSGDRSEREAAHRLAQREMGERLDAADADANRRQDWRR